MPTPSKLAIRGKLGLRGISQRRTQLILGDSYRARIYPLSILVGLGLRRQLVIEIAYLLALVIRKVLLHSRTLSEARRSRL